MMSYGQGRRQQQQEEGMTKGGLNLAEFVRKSERAPLEALSKQMDKDPAGAAQKVYNGVLLMEAMARSTAVDAARGVLTRIIPEPRGTWQKTYRVLEFLYRVYQLYMVVTLATEISGTWTQGPSTWREYMLVLACLQAVWWLFHLASFVGGAMNEKEAFVEFHTYLVDGDNYEVLGSHTETLQLTEKVTSEFNRLAGLSAKDTRGRSSTTSISVAVPNMNRYRTNLETYRQVLAENEIIAPRGPGEVTIKIPGGVRADTTFVPRMPWPNMPHSRFGFLYESMVTAFVLVPLIYLHMLIQDNGTTGYTYNLDRTYRVYLWLELSVLFLNNLIAFYDWFKLIDVVMDFYDAHEMACSQLGLAMGEAMQNFPDLSRTRVLLHFLSDFVITPGALLLGALHAWVLVRWDPTNNGVVNWFEFQTIWFVVFIVFGTAALMCLVGMWFTYDHKCAYRVMWHHAFYWLVHTFLFFTIWYYAWQGRTNRDGLLNTDDLHYFENLIWVGLIGCSIHLYYTQFDKLRTWFGWQFQLAFMPFAYGL